MLTCFTVCARVFAVIDVKGKGSISRDQVVLALRMLNLNPIDSEVETLLNENGKQTRSIYELLHYTRI